MLGGCLGISLWPAPTRASQVAQGRIDLLSAFIIGCQGRDLRLSGRRGEAAVRTDLKGGGGNCPSFQAMKPTRGTVNKHRKMLRGNRVVAPRPRSAG